MPDRRWGGRGWVKSWKGISNWSAGVTTNAAGLLSCLIGAVGAVDRPFTPLDDAASLKECLADLCDGEISLE